jgi:hypothetical protein
MKWRRPPLARVAGKAEDFFMVYELRIYQCVPGLLKHFEDHTLKIWEKHGIR